MSNEVEQLPVFDVQVTEEDMREVEDALRSGWLTMGERTERFEREFAESIGTSRGVALSKHTVTPSARTWRRYGATVHVGGGPTWSTAIHVPLARRSTRARRIGPPPGGVARRWTSGQNRVCERRAC